MPLSISEGFEHCYDEIRSTIEHGRGPNILSRRCYSLISNLSHHRRGCAL